MTVCTDEVDENDIFNYVLDTVVQLAPECDNPYITILEMQIRIYSLLYRSNH